MQQSSEPLIKGRTLNKTVILGVFKKLKEGSGLQSLFSHQSYPS